MKKASSNGDYWLLSGFSSFRVIECTPVIVKTRERFGINSRIERIV